MTRQDAKMIAEELYELMVERGNPIVDNLITMEDAMKKYGKSKSWFYHNAPYLPHHKGVYSETGIIKYLNKNG